MSNESTKRFPAFAIALASSLCASAVAQEAPKPDEPAPAFRAPTGKDAAPPPATEQKPDLSAPPIPTQAAPPATEPDLTGGPGQMKPSQNVVINLINRMVKKGL